MAGVQKIRCGIPLRGSGEALRLRKTREKLVHDDLHVNPGPPLSPFLLPRGNLLPHLTPADLKTCRFHPDKAPFCPILRVGDVVKFAGQDFAKLASTVRTQSLFHDPSEPGHSALPQTWGPLAASGDARVEARR